MKNPKLNEYYHRALRNFAHCLACTVEKNRYWAKELFVEESNEVLESFILKEKAKMDEKEFFFYAGRTFQFVLDEAEQEGTEAWNASVGGLNEFGRFIGLRNNESG